MEKLSNAAGQLQYVYTNAAFDYLVTSLNVNSARGAFAAIISNRIPLLMANSYTGSQLNHVLTVFSAAGATVIPTYISGALTVALPSIGPRIGLAGRDLQWPLSVFSLFNGAFLLLTGGLADGMGRKAVLLLGNAWMVVFLIPLAFTQHASIFIALHGVLGLGAAMLSPAATGIVSESLPNGNFKNGAFAALGAGQPLGFIMGLLLGGIFAHNYAIIFGFAAALSGLFGVMAIFFVPGDGVKLINVSVNSDIVGRQRISLLSFDWLGAGLSVTGLVGVTLGLAFAGTTSAGWNAPSVLVLLPVAVCLLIGFFAWEQQSQRQQQVVASSERRDINVTIRQPALRGPLVPPDIWRAPGFTPALICVWFGWFAFNSLTYYCTLVLQEIQHTTPIQTSIRFLPMVASGISANILGGFLIGRLPIVYIVVFGSIACAGGCAIFATLNPASTYARGLLPVIVLLVGPDLFFPAIQLFACQTVGSHRAALAGSLFSVTTRLATSIGLAMCTAFQSVATARYTRTHSLRPEDTAAILYGYRSIGWLCFACGLMAAFVSLLFLRSAPLVNVSPDVEDISLSESNVNEQPHRGQ